MKQLNRWRLVAFGGILLLLTVFQLSLINVYAGNNQVCKSWISYDPNIRGKACTKIYQNCDFWIHVQNEDPNIKLGSVSIEILKNGKIIAQKMLTDYKGDYFRSGYSERFLLNQTGNYILRRTATTLSGKKLSWKDKTIKVLSVKKCGAGISVSPSTLYVEVGKSKRIRVKHIGLFQQYSGEKVILPNRVALSPQNIHTYATYSFDHPFSNTTDIIIKGISPGTINAELVYRDDISDQILDKKTVKIIVTKKTSVQDKIDVPDNISKVYSSGKRFSLNVHANGILKYTSSSPKVATVSSNGVITMRGYGITTITVSLSDYQGNKITSKKVKISLTPAKVTFTNVALISPGKTTISWLKVSNAQGYQIQCSLSKKFPSIVSQTQNGYIRNLKPNASKYKNTFSILKKNKTWYIRIRAYKKVNGHIVNGPWSNVKQIFVK